MPLSEGRIYYLWCSSDYYIFSVPNLKRYTKELSIHHGLQIVSLLTFSLSPSLCHRNCHIDCFSFIRS